MNGEHGNAAEQHEDKKETNHTESAKRKKTTGRNQG